MAEWAYVENNEIVELHDLLPVSWRNISGLRNAADNIEFLNSVGWYKVTKQVTEYDDTQFKISGHNHTFSNGVVTQTAIIVDRNVDEEPFHEKKIRFMVELRAARDKLLLDSDKTQLMDNQAKLSDELKYKWTMYRQSLRDIPQQYISNDTIDIGMVVWPNLNNFTYTAPGSQADSGEPAIAEE